MAPSFSKILDKNSFGLFGSLFLTYWLSKRILKHRRKWDLDEVSIEYTQKQGDEEKKKAKVDANFLRKLWQILKIIIPGPITPEIGYLLLITLSLVGRTVGDLFIISNSTQIERGIISKDYDLYMNGLRRFIRAIPLLNLTNILIKFSVGQLVEKLRARLSHHLYDQYLSGLTFYQLSNIDHRIKNPDHVLTQEVLKFCQTLTDFYTNVTKPFLDLIIYAQALTTGIGFKSPGLLVLYLLFAGLLISRLRRPLSQMAMTEQKLEGELNYVGTRLIMNSEEIAFYRGNEKEKKTLKNTLKRLINHQNTSNYFLLCFSYIENTLTRYWGTVVGYVLVSQPFFSDKLDFLPQGHRIEYYYVGGRMMLKIAESIGRMVVAGRYLSRLSGYTARLSLLMEALKDLNNGQVANLTPKEGGNVIIQDHIIKFDHVPLMTPNGDVLINDLNFEVRAGTNVLVCGPNGCGKSSLFRILGELWPVQGGTLTKPPASRLFYIPQKPYMPLGTLRDQITYPDTLTQVKQRGITDEDLAEVLEQVQLSYLLEREPQGWDTIQNWMEKLSGGEKQRIAMARLLYSHPQFAILDECTSAVSADVEALLYERFCELGITLFTVSHRKSLWKYHKYCLYMDGEGGYTFKKINPDLETQS